MPAGEDQERERFAAAVERGLGAVPPGGAEDEAELLQELELVALLRKSRVSLTPSADESARMRAKVMAAAATMMSPVGMSPVGAHDDMLDTVPGAEPVAPTLVNARLATGVDADAPTQVDTTRVDHSPVGATGSYTEDDGETEQPSNVVSIGRAGRGRHRFPTEPPARTHRGLLGIGAAAAVMVVAVTGGGAMFSQGALPGDSLYGIKQTTESAMVGLTPGQGNKAQRQLDYASTRIDEVQKVSAASSAPNDKSADISQALKGFDDQTQDGSKLWLDSASSRSGSDNSAQLSQLSSWAQQQNQRIATMRASMPASAQPDADHSMRLLEDLRTRAQSLNNRQGCDHVTSGTDELGPVPAKGACKLSVNTSAPTEHSTTEKSSDESSSSSEEDSSPSSSEDSSDSSSSDDHHSSSDDTTKKDKPELVPGLSGGSDSNKDKHDQLFPPQNTANKGDGLLGGLLKPLAPKN